MSGSDVHPMPQINEMLPGLGDVQYVTKLDLPSDICCFFWIPRFQKPTVFSTLYEAC